MPKEPGSNVQTPLRDSRQSSPLKKRFSNTENTPSKTTSTAKYLSPPKILPRSFTDSLEENRTIFGIYGFLNSFNDIFMGAKWVSDLKTASSAESNDLLHEWMASPEGFWTIIGSTIGFAALSTLANYFKENDKNPYKRFLAEKLPLLRETLKGLRYTYKGFRSTFQLMIMLGAADLRYLLMPLGLIVGVLAAYNRVWHRQMYKARKTHRKILDELCNTIHCAAREETTLSGNKDPILSQIGQLLTMLRSTSEESTESLERQMLEQNIQKSIDQYHETTNAARTKEMDQITQWREILKNNRASDGLKLRSFLSVGLGAVLDNMYQYFGLVGLAALCPPMYITMVACCVLYSIIHLVTKLYEEHVYQQELEFHVLRVEIALCYREVRLLLSEAWEREETDASLLTLQSRITEKLKTLNTLETKRDQLTTLTTWMVLLTGLKAGLSAYSVITACLFVVGLLVTMTATAFPPEVLIAGILAGIVCLIAFTTYAFTWSKQHNHSREKLKRTNSSDLLAETRASTLINSPNKSPKDPLDDSIKSKTDNLPALKLDNQSPLETLNTEDGELNNILRKSMVREQFITHLKKCRDLNQNKDWDDPELGKDNAEVYRQGLTGGMKARQTFTFFANASQTHDTGGHWQDNPALLPILVPGMLLYLGVFSARQAAKNAGKSRPLSAAPAAPKSTTNASMPVPREFPQPQINPPPLPTQATLVRNDSSTESFVVSSLIDRLPKKIYRFWDATHSNQKANCASLLQPTPGGMPRYEQDGSPNLGGSLF